MEIRKSKIRNLHTLHVIYINIHIIYKYTLYIQKYTRTEAKHSRTLYRIQTQFTGGKKNINTTQKGIYDVRMCLMHDDMLSNIVLC